MKSIRNYAENKLNKINIEETIKQQFNDLIKTLKRELYKVKEINSVILFGSFSREDFSLRHSDIDLMIFLDKEEKNNNLEEKIRKKIINLNLGKELSIHAVFQYKKIEDEDKSLMLTISKEGQVIFAKKSLIISRNQLGLKEYFLIRFDTTKTEPVIKNKLQRFLHGYIIKGKRYKGIVDEEKVFSAGRGAIIVPQDLSKKIMLFAHNIGIKATQKGKFYKS